MQAWEMYLDELRRRSPGGGLPLGGRERMGEAVHDTYRVVSDRLTSEYEWDDEHTLVVMRGLNAAVRDWMDAGAADWTELGHELERREAELRDGF